MSLEKLLEDALTKKLETEDALSDELAIAALTFLSRRQSKAPASPSWSKNRIWKQAIDLTCSLKRGSKKVPQTLIALASLKDKYGELKEADRESLYDELKGRFIGFSTDQVMEGLEIVKSIDPSIHSKSLSALKFPGIDPNILQLADILQVPAQQILNVYSLPSISTLVEAAIGAKVNQEKRNRSDLGPDIKEHLRSQRVVWQSLIDKEFEQIEVTERIEISL